MEVQAILQEKKIIKQIKTLSQYCHWLFQFILPAGWLSELEFNLQKKNINNFKNKQFLLLFHPLSTQQTKPEAFDWGFLNIRGSGVYSGVSALEFQLIPFPDF